MKKEVESIIFNQEEGLMEAFQQSSFFMGSVLVFLNLFLMFCVGAYWTNPAIHLYISGKPLWTMFAGLWVAFAING